MSTALQAGATPDRRTPTSAVQSAGVAPTIPRSLSGTGPSLEQPINIRTLSVNTLHALRNRTASQGSGNGVLTGGRQASVSNNNAIASESASPATSSFQVATERGGRDDTANTAAGHVRSRSASPANSGASTSTTATLGASSGQTPLSRGSSANKGLSKAMTLIEYRGLRFVIMDAPSETNVAHYAKELQRFGVTDVARACEPTYSADALSMFSMKLHELNFKDGDPPPLPIVEKWLQLVACKFLPANPKDPPPSDTAIAVHCVAGLGRAPVLVAIALIEAGMPPLEAVEFIRAKRRGALNMKQIHFLDSYKRRGKGKFSALPGSPSDSGTGGGSGKGGSDDKDKCSIM